VGDPYNRPSRANRNKNYVTGLTKTKTAILLMLVPESFTGLDRLLAAVYKYKGDADVYASLDLEYRPNLPRWVSSIIPSSPPPYGIVRPTKYAIRYLTDYDWVLRLTWDAELLHSIDFDRDEHTVYGPMVGNGGFIAENIHRFLMLMGSRSPAKEAYEYINGHCILAPRHWWTNIFCELPPEIIHYYDDSVSFVFGLEMGYKFKNILLAHHQHNGFRN
jgi:hypothetical protein